MSPSGKYISEKVIIRIDPLEATGHPPILALEHGSNERLAMVPYQPSDNQSTVPKRASSLAVVLRSQNAVSKVQRNLNATASSLPPKERFALSSLSSPFPLLGGSCLGPLATPLVRSPIRQNTISASTPSLFKKPFRSVHLDRVESVTLARAAAPLPVVPPSGKDSTMVVITMQQERQIIATANTATKPQTSDPLIKLYESSPAPSANIQSVEEPADGTISVEAQM